MTTSYPEAWEVGEHEWIAGFEFPVGFVQEVKARFPDWKSLHTWLDQNDPAVVWGLFRLFRNRLAAITPEEIILAGANNAFGELLERAKLSLEIGKLIAGWEQHYFPEIIAERKRYQDRAALSYL